MRLDKFLKVSRVIKRRTLAKEVASDERILLNDKIAKPSSQLKPGDIITILFGNKEVKIRVLELLDSTKKADTDKMYELISERKINPAD
ncbi:MAG: RNA-binding S4 domain-containing protein [Acholeplasmatales bacterium]|nr:RNA-binding S4 domain-containing protein [Acholeplasmatales bacterium]